LANKDSSGVNESLEDEIIVEERTKLPRKYAVIIHNDDFTPQDYVVLVLQRFFSKSPVDAFQLMLKVHKIGKAQAGVYTKDVAESKVHQVSSDARAHNYPLKLSFEPE